MSISPVCSNHLSRNDFGQRVWNYASPLLESSSPSHPGNHFWLALTIWTKSGLRLAPPTRLPSTSGQAASSRQLAADTLPPYRMRRFSETSAETLSFSHFLRAA